MNGTQEQPIMELQVFQIVLHSQLFQHLKICPDFKIPIITHLKWGYQGQPLVTKGNKWWDFTVERISSIHNEWNT